jgi:beta-glucosidase/6-phospho-beta-glucosidase/beta-galactosidase
VRVEYGAGRRIPKQSARWYSQVIARNGLDE